MTIIHLSDGNKYEFSTVPQTLRTAELYAILQTDPGPLGTRALASLIRISLEPSYSAEEINEILELVQTKDEEVIALICDAMFREADEPSNAVDAPEDSALCNGMGDVTGSSSGGPGSGTADDRGHGGSVPAGAGKARQVG